MDCFYETVIKPKLMVFICIRVVMVMVYIFTAVEQDYNIRWCKEWDIDVINLTLLLFGRLTNAFKDFGLGKKLNTLREASRAIIRGA